MADIPAANITLKERISVGNLTLWKAKIYGDGTGVTVPTPITRIMGTWVGNIDETAGYSPALSTSGNVVTYGAAPTNTKYHWLYVLGTD